MPKTILVTGSTDGIGLLTAKLLKSRGHDVLLHGRSAEKLRAAEAETGAEGLVADLSSLAAVQTLAKEVIAKRDRLDVLINNAGVLKAPQTRTAEGLDLRYVVNTLAPALLARLLTPIMPRDGRVVNLSSAAQAPVDIAALTAGPPMQDTAAYAQSKLALTIWSQEEARRHPEGPAMIAVNPGSLLASKMVKEGFGIDGGDLGVGAGILIRAALDGEFADASGRYFDNDAGRFAPPHDAAADADHASAVMQAIDDALADLI